MVAGSSNGGKVATTSTDDDEEYFEPSKNGLQNKIDLGDGDGTRHLYFFIFFTWLIEWT